MHKIWRVVDLENAYLDGDFPFPLYDDPSRFLGFRVLYWSRDVGTRIYASDFAVYGHECHLKRISANASVYVVAPLSPLFGMKATPTDEKQNETGVNVKVYENARDFGVVCGVVNNRRHVLPVLGRPRLTYVSEARHSDCAAVDPCGLGPRRLHEFLATSRPPSPCLCLSTWSGSSFSSSSGPYLHPHPAHPRPPSSSSPFSAPQFCHPSDPSCPLHPSLQPASSLILSPTRALSPRTAASVLPLQPPPHAPAAVSSPVPRVRA